MAISQNRVASMFVNFILTSQEDHLPALPQSGPYFQRLIERTTIGELAKARDLHIERIKDEYINLVVWSEPLDRIAMHTRIVQDDVFEENQRFEPLDSNLRYLILEYRDGEGDILRRGFPTLSPTDHIQDIYVKMTIHIGNLLLQAIILNKAVQQVSTIYVTSPIDCLSSRIFYIQEIARTLNVGEISLFDLDKSQLQSVRLDKMRKGAYHLGVLMKQGYRILLTLRYHLQEKHKDSSQDILPLANIRELRDVVWGQLFCSIPYNLEKKLPTSIDDSIVTLVDIIISIAILDKATEYLDEERTLVDSDNGDYLEC